MDVTWFGDVHLDGTSMGPPIFDAPLNYVKATVSGGQFVFDAAAAGYGYNYPVDLMIGALNDPYNPTAATLHTFTGPGDGLLVEVDLSLASPNFWFVLGVSDPTQRIGPRGHSLGCYLGIFGSSDPDPDYSSDFEFGWTAPDEPDPTGNGWVYTDGTIGLDRTWDPVADRFLRISAEEGGTWAASSGPTPDHMTLLTGNGHVFDSVPEITGIPLRSLRPIPMSGFFADINFTYSKKTPAGVAAVDDIWLDNRGPVQEAASSNIAVLTSTGWQISHYALADGSMFNDTPSEAVL